MACLIEHSDGANGNGNRKSISVEICRPTNSDRSLYNQAEENAVYVVARLLYQYGLGIDRLKKHQDWSGKKCPNVILSEKRWDGFVGRVQWVLDEIKKGNIDKALSSGTTSVKQSSQQSATPKPSSTTNSFKVRIKCDALNIRKSADFNSAVVGTVKKGEVYTIVETSNGLGLLKSNVGWISMGSAYVEKI